MVEGGTMVNFHSGITLIFLTFAHLEAVYGNCSGGVTSQTVSYGDSGMSELMLPSVIRYITCTWEVKSNTNGLRLDLENFIIPLSDHCEQGYLEITVGDYGKFDSVSLDKWCGEFFPRSLHLSGHVFIRLHLQRTQARVGFKLKYTSVLPSEFCPPATVNLTGSGYIYSPGYGGHWTVAPSLVCRWQIEADPGHVIQVELRHVDFSQWACSRQQAELIAYDGNAFLNQLGTWCSTDVLTVVKSTRPGLHLSYINRVPHRGTGFVLKYYQVPDYHSDCAPYVRDVTARRTPSFIQIYQSPGRGQKTCRWNITSENNSEVVVMETEYYDLGTLGCSYVELSYYDGPGASHNLQRHICSGIKLPSHSVIQSSGRHAYIDMKYNSISQPVEAVRALIKVYSVPRVPCWNEHRMYTSDESVSRLWISIDNTTQHSGCDIRIESRAPNSCIKVEITAKTDASLFIYNYFNIYNGLTTSASMYEPRCSTSGKSYTYSTGPSLLLVRQSSSLNHLVTLPAIDGFWLEYSSGKSCDIEDYTEIDAGVQEYNSFIIPPPSYVSQNRNVSQLCRYVIRASTRSVIQLYLSDQTAAKTTQSDCNDTAAVISDGIEDEGVIGWWCSGRGEDYVSNNNKVYISYMHRGSTSRHNQHPPVYVNYRSKPKANCHQFLLAPEGSALTISSPYYPKYYPNNATCSWKIRASRSNFRVEMNVKEMHIDVGHNTTCMDDYLAFYDGSSASSREIKRYCGQEVDTRPQRSSGQLMYVEFASDEQMTARGFQATYKSIKLYKCNETLWAPDQGGPEQFLSSPNFPSNYYGNMACYWLLQTTKDYVIQTEMAFAEFTGSHSTCSGDYLSFYDGKDETASLIGRVCGIELPTYRSTGRQMYIVFQANNDLVTGRGFQLQYKSTFIYGSCQAGSIGRLHGNTSKSGILTSPFYPMGFPAGLNCRWRISSISGKQIEVKVEQSDIAADCDIFQVIFYDGPAPNGATLGTWCGERDRYFTTTDNTMYISFHSSIKTRAGFKLSYKALGFSLSRSSTALIVGIIIGSIVLVCILFSIGICCCCCRSKRKKKAPSESETETETESNSRADKKNVTEPLIGHPRKYVKDSKLPDGSLVPSAPPMEDDSGIVNAGFLFGEGRSQIPKAQSLYPALPTNHDLQKTITVVDHLLQHDIKGKFDQHQGRQNCGRQGFPQQPGHKIRHPLQPIQEVSIPEKDVLVSRQYHLGNSCNHANITRQETLGPHLFQPGKEAFEGRQVESEAHSLRPTEHVLKDEQIRREPELARTESRPSPSPEQMKFVEIIEYGGGKGESRGKKDRKHNNKKKTKHTNINDKTGEPLKQSLKKLSSIECSEEDNYDEAYQSQVSHALQERHQIPTQYPPDPSLHYPEEPLSNVPIVLSPSTYLSQSYLNPAAQDCSEKWYQDQPYRQTPWLPCHEAHQHHFQGLDSASRDGETHQVIHAEVHSATPNITSLYPCTSLSEPIVSVPKSKEALYGANVFNKDRITNPNPTDDVRMYPVLNTASGSAHPGTIWSTDQPMVIPHFTPLLDELDGVPKEQTIWRDAPVTSNIQHVPMLVPIYEPKSTTSPNHDSDTCYVDMSLALDEERIQDDDNFTGTTESKEDGDISDDEAKESLSANKHPVDEERVQDDESSPDNCMAKENNEISDDCANEPFVPPDPAQLTNILPPLHWISDSQQSGCTDSLVTASTTEIAFQEKELSERFSNNVILPTEDDSESEEVSDANMDNLDVEATMENAFPEVSSPVSTKTPDQSCHDHTVNAPGEELSQHKENKSGNVSELINECQADEEPVEVFQLHAAPKPMRLSVEDYDLDSGNDDEEHQRKLEVLLQRGFTDEDVENMDESAV